MRPSRIASNRSVAPPTCVPPIQICGMVGEPVRALSTGADPAFPCRSSAAPPSRGRRSRRRRRGGRRACAPPSRTRTTRARTSRRRGRRSTCGDEGGGLGIASHRRPPAASAAAAGEGHGCGSGCDGRALAPAPAHRSDCPASSARGPAPRRSCRRRCPRTAASTGSARRCRAACRRCGCPRGARRATSSAAASVAPLEVPTKMPSCVASSRARRSASLPFTGTISSTSPSAIAFSVRREMKSGLQPCIRCGRNIGWLALGWPPASRGWAMPLPSSGALSGSAATMRIAGIGGLQPARRAEQRAAGAEAGDEGMDPLAFEVGEDLARRRAGVHVGVGLVVELAAEEPAVLLGQLDRLVEHAAALLARGREHHPGAEEAQELAPLDAEALGHRQHQRIALLGADHRQADAGVAAGRLDHGLAGRRAAPRRSASSITARGHAVLDRAERVERFELDVDLDARRARAG